MTQIEIRKLLYGGRGPRGKERAVLKGVYGYKVEPDRSAPSEQCGKLSIVLSEINAFGG